MIDPYLDADFAVGCDRLSETIIDIRSQCVKGNITLAVFFAPRDFSTVQSSGAENLDSLRTGLHRSADRLLHCSSEGDSVLQRIGDALCSKLSVQFASSDLFDGDRDILVCQFLKIFLQFIDSRAGTSDDHTRSGCQNSNLHFVLGSSLDQDSCDSCSIQRLLDELSDLIIFSEKFREVVLAGVPFRIPVLDYAYS